MEKVLSTYFVKVQDMPDKDIKVEILDDGDIKKVAVNGKVYEVDYNLGGDRIYSMIIDHKSYGIQISAAGTNSYEVKYHEDTFLLDIMNELDKLRSESASESVSGNQIVMAPMSGVILKTLVKPGDEIEKGTPLCILVAMKMENEIKAETSGTVTEVFVADGEKVNVNDKLMIINA